MTQRIRHKPVWVGISGESNVSATGFARRPPDEKITLTAGFLQYLMRSHGKFVRDVTLIQARYEQQLQRRRRRSRKRR